MDKKFIETTLALIDFISDSPSCYHVVSNASAMFKDAGFTELSEKESFVLEKGKSYFVSRNGSALVAFSVPSEDPKSWKIIASHTDAPCFKIKENPENGTSFTVLNVESYGGMLMAPWFDRPLSIAGRAFVKEKGNIVQKNVDLDRDLCSIVNLCIHQNREANNGHKYSIQKELMPIIAQGANPGLVRKLVAESLDIEESDILDTELFLYNREIGRIWGNDDEFFSSPKIDDLMCTWASINALISSKSSDSIKLVTLFDNEEVGSLTKQGANGDFLIQTINRISDALKINYQKKCSMQACSFMLSADNGHSMHPNYPEKCDITNKPETNKGILIKYAGNQKYTTDGFSGAVFKDILTKNNVPYQVAFNNSDVTGGSTLGNISQSQFSIPCVDIGAAQLAMHSPYETAGTMDTYYLTEGMKAFFESPTL